MTTLFFSHVLRNIDNFISDNLKRKKTIHKQLKEICEQYKKDCSMLNQKRFARNKILLSKTDVQQKSADFILHSALSKEISLLSKSNLEMRTFLQNEINKLGNLLHASVDENNQVIYNSHNVDDLDVSLDRSDDFLHNYIDKEKAANISGSKFAVLSVQGSAIMRLLQNILILNASRSHSELYLPVIVNKKALENSAHWYFFAEEIFSLSNEERYLIPTSEVTILNFHANENLTETKRYFCICNCFRKEAGTYGKSNFSIQRLHQFSKLELFTFCSMQNSEIELTKMIDLASDALRALELPFRIIRNAIDDTSSSAYITFDIEVWCSSFGWMEISSCSNVLFFQSSRAQISINGECVATLNGTALACERLLISFLDNNKHLSYDELIRKLQAIKNKLENAERIH